MPWLIGLATALVVVAAALTVGSRAGLVPRVGAAPSPVQPVPSQIRGLATLRVVVGGESLDVAVADTEPEREAGLMGVTNLGPLDGMLFVFPAPVRTAFWMKSTLVPLDIAFFDAAGTLVAAMSMTPCRADPCPTYGPTLPYLWALEVPAGRFGRLPASSRLSFDGGQAPVGK